MQRHRAHAGRGAVGLEDVYVDSDKRRLGIAVTGPEREAVRARIARGRPVAEAGEDVVAERAVRGRVGDRKAQVRILRVPARAVGLLVVPIGAVERRLLSALCVEGELGWALRRPVGVNSDLDADGVRLRGCIVGVEGERVRPAEAGRGRVLEPALADRPETSRAPVPSPPRRSACRRRCRCSSHSRSGTAASRTRSWPSAALCTPARRPARPVLRPRPRPSRRRRR
jgi:hypothetical protein